MLLFLSERRLPAIIKEEMAVSSKMKWEMFSSPERAAQFARGIGNIFDMFRLGKAELRERAKQGQPPEPDEI